MFMFMFMFIIEPTVVKFIFRSINKLFLFSLIIDIHGFMDS
jgi:hypothetical protein